MKVGSIIVIEGNICAGKSTLCQNIGSNEKYVIFKEPALENPYLKRYYENPKKYGLTMQLHMIRIRFETYVEAIKLALAGKDVILDRSIYSDYVFAKKNYKDGNISEKGFEYYMEVRRKMLMLIPLPSIVLFLDCSSKICHNRIKELRCIDCECSIQLDYLDGLDDEYKVLIKEFSNVISIDWNKFGNTKDVVDMIEKNKKSIICEDIIDTLVNDTSVLNSIINIDFDITDELYFDDKDKTNEIFISNGIEKKKIVNVKVKDIF